MDSNRRRLFTASLAASLAAAAAAGMPALAANAGDGRHHGRQAAAVRVQRAHRRHPVVRAGREQLRVPQGRRPDDGPVRPPAAGPEPLSVGRQRRGVQEARGPDPRARHEVRHPRHARHPAPGRAPQHADPRYEPARAGHRGHELDLHVERRHVRRRHDEAGRTGLLRFGIQAVRRMGRRLRQDGRHVAPVRKELARSGSRAQGHRGHGPPHRAVAVAGRDGPALGQPRAAPCADVAHLGRLLGRMAPARRTVPAAGKLESRDGRERVAGRRHAAAGPPRAGRARHQVHPGRAADADDVVEHRPLPADHGRRPAPPRRADARAADEPGSAGREPAQPRQPSASRGRGHPHLERPRRGQARPAVPRPVQHGGCAGRHRVRPVAPGPGRPQRGRARPVGAARRAGRARRAAGHAGAARVDVAGPDRLSGDKGVRGARARRRDGRHVRLVRLPCAAGGGRDARRGLRRGSRRAGVLHVHRRAPSGRVPLARDVARDHAHRRLPVHPEQFRECVRAGVRRDRRLPRAGVAARTDVGGGRRDHGDAAGARERVRRAGGAPLQPRGARGIPGARRAAARCRARPPDGLLQPAPPARPPDARRRRARRHAHRRAVRHRPLQAHQRHARPRLRRRRAAQLRRAPHAHDARRRGQRRALRRRGIPRHPARHRPGRRHPARRAPAHALCRNRLRRRAHDGELRRRQCRCRPRRGPRAARADRRGRRTDVQGEEQGQKPRTRASPAMNSFGPTKAHDGYTASNLYDPGRQSDERRRLSFPREDCRGHRYVDRAQCGRRHDRARRRMGVRQVEHHQDAGRKAGKAKNGLFLRFRRMGAPGRPAAAGFPREPDDSCDRRRLAGRKVSRSERRDRTRDQVEKPAGRTLVSCQDCRQEFAARYCWLPPVAAAVPHFRTARHPAADRRPGEIRVPYQFERLAAAHSRLVFPGRRPHRPDPGRPLPARIAVLAP
ncbi:hypothetical protein Lal_00015001 [Lupinus albus]|nr:hypothetical protein Lal_00015001 [Lupinus albus]